MTFSGHRFIICLRPEIFDNNLRVCFLVAMHLIFCLVSGSNSTTFRLFVGIFLLCYHRNESENSCSKVSLSTYYSSDCLDNKFNTSISISAMLLFKRNCFGAGHLSCDAFKKTTYFIPFYNPSTDTELVKLKQID